MSDILLYRLVKQKWQKNAFDGEGARLYGGRWNSNGRPAVYLSSSISLGLLEIMVHLQDYQALQNYVVFEVRIPGNIVHELPADLYPQDWRDEPAPASTALIGDEWLDQRAGLALAIPSAVVHVEKNYLLTPEHPDFSTVAGTARKIEFRADPRL